MYKRDSLNSDLVETIPAYPAKDGCLSRIPYSSVMAFVMCVVGVIMFAIMMIWSFNASVEQARRALDITNIPWLERVSTFYLFIYEYYLLGVYLYMDIFSIQEQIHHSHFRSI